MQERTLATIPKLLSNLRGRVNFKGGRHSLWRIVKGLGFRWKKSNSRMVLIEKQYMRYI
jgi:transposase